MPCAGSSSLPACLPSQPEPVHLTPVANSLTSPSTSKIRSYSLKLPQIRGFPHCLSHFLSYKRRLVVGTFIPFGETTVLTVGNGLAMVHIIPISCGQSGCVIRSKNFGWWGVMSGLGRMPGQQSQARPWKEGTFDPEVCRWVLRGLSGVPVWKALDGISCLSLVSYVTLGKWLNYSKLLILIFSSFKRKGMMVWKWSWKHFAKLYSPNEHKPFLSSNWQYFSVATTFTCIVHSHHVMQ